MVRQNSLKLVLSVAAASMAVGMTAPALAGGYANFGYSSPAYYGGYYSAGYSNHNYYRGGRRHHRRHHGHGGHGGGKAAAIALGVIGGAIILNEIAEDRARERAYEDRYYERRARYDRRYSRRAEPVYVDREYEGAPQDGDLDTRLEGRADGGPEPIRLSYRGAYEACTKHARAALSNRGFILAAPARPETVEQNGRAWKMTANVTAQNRSGDSWTRAMFCEADENRVYLLELI